MSGFNLNEFAKKVTMLEGGKIRIGMGQVKEVMKITLSKLARLDEASVKSVLSRYTDPKYDKFG